MKKIRNYVFGMALFLWLSLPMAVYSAEEDLDETEDLATVQPEFSNPAQAQHAENLAAISFANENVETKAFEDYADDYAKEQAETYIEDLATAHATKVAHSQYPDVLPDPDNKEDDSQEGYWDAYDEAYNAAIDRAYGEWEGPNAYETAYDRIYNETIEKGVEGIPEELREDYLAEAVLSMTGAQYSEIHRMRYEEKKGWGLIAKELGVHPSVLGLGHSKQKGLEIEEQGIELFEAPDTDPIEAEIMEATQRNVKTGWNKESKGNKGKKGHSNQTFGLNETSSDAAAAASGGLDKGSRGQGSSIGGGKSNGSKSSVSSQASSKNNNGKSGVSSQAGSKGNNGKGSSNSNAGGNKGGKGKK